MFSLWPSESEVALTRYLAGMLYGLTALDPVVYALAAVAFTNSGQLNVAAGAWPVRASIGRAP